MFKVNQLVVYENSGVCRIEKIEEVPFPSGPRTCYILKPVYTKEGTIYSPVNNPNVMMRPVITKEEALELIHGIPETEIQTSAGIYWEGNQTEIGIRRVDALARRLGNLRFPRVTAFAVTHRK